MARRRPQTLNPKPWHYPISSKARFRLFHRLALPVSDAHACTRPPTHPLTHPPTYPPAHPPTHPLTVFASAVRWHGWCAWNLCHRVLLWCHGHPPTHPLTNLLPPSLNPPPPNQRRRTELARPLTTSPLHPVPAGVRSSCAWARVVTSEPFATLCSPLRIAATHQVTHSLTHSLTHPLTHSLTPPPRRQHDSLHPPPPPCRCPLQPCIGVCGGCGALCPPPSKGSSPAVVVMHPLTDRPNHSRIHTIINPPTCPPAPFPTPTPTTTTTITTLPAGVRSRRALARVVSVDPSAALCSPGVVACVTAGDIPGTNMVFGAPLLAGERLTQQQQQQQQ